MSETKILKGERHNFGLSEAGDDQSFMQITMNYGLLRKIVKPDMFSAATGEGEQRAPKKGRINKLRKAIENNRYSVTGFGVSIRGTHEVKTEKGKVVSISVSSDNPLALIDGNHRREALEQIRMGGSAIQKKVDMLPIPCIINLNDAKRKECFINYQDKFAVDQAQMLTMKICSEQFEEKKQDVYEPAMVLGLHLDRDPSSYLTNMIRMDTLSDVGLKFKTLAPDRASDLAVSLYGSSLIMGDFFSAKEMGEILITAYQWLKDEAPKLVDRGGVLCPVVNKGSVGSTMLLTGLGNMLAYRLRLQERRILTEEDKKHFVHTAHMVFDGESYPTNVERNWKQFWVGSFAREYFRDLLEADDCEFASHEGIPIPLILLMETSAFNVSKISKPVGRPPKNVEENVPDTVGETMMEKEDVDTDPKFVEDEDEEDPFTPSESDENA